LASSFVAGVLSSPASAGRCDRFCDFCTCTMFKCCDGVCENLGPCRFSCPLVPC
jgi:hypothetical protein